MNKTILAALFLIALAASAFAEDAKYSTVVLKDFSIEGMKLQENEDTKAFAETLPTDFSTWVKEYLDDMKVADNIVVAKEGEAYENAVVVEGTFTKITAGSTAARWIVGFGAGSSTVGAEWTVKDSSGKELGTYKKNQHTASGARGKTALESDARHLAKYVATTIKKLLK